MEGANYKNVKDLRVELKCLRTTTLMHMSKKKPLHVSSATNTVH